MGEDVHEVKSIDSGPAILGALEKKIIQCQELLNELNGRIDYRQVHLQYEGLQSDKDDARDFNNVMISAREACVSFKTDDEFGVDELRKVLKNLEDWRKKIDGLCGRPPPKAATVLEFGAGRKEKRK